MTTRQQSTQAYFKINAIQVPPSLPNRPFTSKRNIRLYSCRWPLAVFRRFFFLFCHVGRETPSGETVYLYWLDACFISDALISVTQLRDTWRASFPTMTQHAPSSFAFLTVSFLDWCPISMISAAARALENSVANPREREKFLNRFAPSARDVPASFSLRARSRDQH